MFCRRIELYVVIFTAILSSIYGLASGSTGNIKIVFRYDDPSAFSDLAIERQIIEIFKEHQMSCIWSIIPFAAEDSFDPDSKNLRPLCQEKAAFYAEAAEKGAIEIALHGYAHQCNGVKEQSSEFEGLSLEEQRDRIQKGRNFLRDVFNEEITIFAPPWNSYDLHTIGALESSGFEVITAGMYGENCRTSSLAFLPATCGPNELKQAVLWASKNTDRNALIVVLFHEYDFQESRFGRGIITLERFAEIIQWLSDQEDVSVVRAGSLSDMGPERYAANKKLRELANFLPRKLRRDFNWQVYLSTQTAEKAGYQSVASAVIFYGGVCFFAGVTFHKIGYRFYPVMPGVVRKFLFYSASIMVVFIFGRLFYNTGTFERPAYLVFISALAGYCGGIWSVALVRNREY